MTRSLALLALAPLALAGCASPDVALEASSLGVEAAPEGAGHFGLVPASSKITGFHYNAGQAVLETTDVRRLVVEVAYRADATSTFSSASTLFDSAWADDPDARLLATRDYKDCAVNARRGITCTFDSFVGRPGEYAFTATAESLGSTEQATWTTQFVRQTPVIRTVATSTDPADRVITIAEGRSSIKAVELHGSPYERGYHHGYLLADDVVGMLTLLLADNYQKGARVVRTSYGNVCYNTIPSGTRFQTIRRNVSLGVDLPDDFRTELQGIVDGVKAKKGTVNLTLAATSDCPSSTFELGIEDLIALNTLDEFCRSFAVWGGRVIDASTKPGQGSLMASSIEWYREMGRYNYLFIQVPDDGTPFVQASWAGFITAYGPLMNRDAVTTTGIMSHPGRLAYGGNYSDPSVDLWYRRILLGDRRPLVGAELREDIVDAASTDELVNLAMAGLPETFTNHGVTIDDGTLGPDGSPTVIETHWSEGVDTREEGTCAREPERCTMSFPYYNEDDYLASTWCGQFLHDASNDPDDPAYHCQDGVSGGASYWYADDYNRIGLQIERPGKGIVGLASAHRILQEVAENDVLHFVIFLPAQKEMLLGLSTATSGNGGHRDNMVFLSWDQIERIYTR